MELKGTIKKKMDVQTFPSGFQKRDFVLQTNEQYPQFIEMQLLKDRVDALDFIEVGDYVEVKFDIKGREWTNPQGEVKYFNSIVAWSIVKQEAVQPEYSTPAPSPTAKEGKVKPNPENPFADDEEDDLPF